MNDDIRYVTIDEAISLLPDGNSVHTFYNEPWGLIGCDWNREDIIDKLRKSDFITITGPTARKTNHGLAAYNKNAKQSDILFIETDKNRLDKFDEIIKEGSE